MSSTQAGGIEASGANAAQIEFWNGRAGASWSEYQQHMDALLAPLSNAALAAAAARAGERALDVGCGCGDTALALARAGAQVTGIDISEPMLARARERAHAASLPVEFVLADASTHAFTPGHDLLFSRFGVMFFADPAAAFANLRTALLPGGRLAFVCWQTAADNAWISAPVAALAAVLPPMPPTDPRAPGPFAFADRAYLTDVLTRAGFADIGIEHLETTLGLGADVDDAIRFTTRIGPLAQPLTGLDDAGRTRALDALRAYYTGVATTDGVRLGARCWVVTARRA